MSEPADREQSRDRALQRQDVRDNESGTRDRLGWPTQFQIEVRRFWRDAGIFDLGKRELNALPRLLSYYLDLEEQLKKGPAQRANRLVIYGLLLTTLQLVVIIAGIFIGNKLAGGK